MMFRLGEAVAPALAARAATRIWFRLPAPAGSVDQALPEGGRPFVAAWEGHVVRGRVWGEGPVVHLVHGWGGRGGQLGAFVAPLVASGHRVVLFDGPSHGESDPGDWGRRATHGVELRKALGAVAARFGPAHAVIAHSMGAVVTMLALRHGSLAADRLVFLAPLSSYEDVARPFRVLLGLGRRTARRFDAAVWRRVGIAPEEFSLATQLDRATHRPLLVVHDRGDRQTSARRSTELVQGRPGTRLVLTDGLGHNRLLADPGVVAEVVGFVAGEPVTTDPVVSEAPAQEAGRGPQQPAA